MDAAVAHGRFKQFVYTSADRGGFKSNSNPTNIPHFISKYHVEKHLVEQAKSARMGFTVLRPVAFMENVTNNIAGEFIHSLFVNLMGSPVVRHTRM